MAQQAHVPKFGNWEGDNDVPYTQYFDKARKGKNAGKLINPNDPQENMESFAQDMPVRASPSRIASGSEAPRSKNGDVHWPTGSPLGKAPSDSPQHRYGDHKYPSDPTRRARRASGGSDRSLEQSPLHSNARVGSRIGVNSPSWERKGSESHGLAPNTPGRARTRLGDRENETPAKVSAVPMFGAWDEGDPASADGFTHIFDKVREERQDGSVRVPPASKQSSYRNDQKPHSYDEPKVGLSSSCRYSCDPDNYCLYGENTMVYYVNQDRLDERSSWIGV